MLSSRGRGLEAGAAFPVEGPERSGRGSEGGKPGVRLGGEAGALPN